MQEFVRHVPDPLVLGTLVGIFFSIYRHNRTTRVRFWIVAWSLIFLHFLVPIIQLHPTRAARLIEALDTTSLQVAGVAFLFSLAPMRLTERARWICLSAVSLPLAIYSVLWSLGYTARAPFAACVLLVTFCGVGLYHYYCINRDFYDNIIESAVVLVGIASFYQVYIGNLQSPYYAMMMATYALSAIFVIRHYWRYSPGVLVTAGGLCAWSAVWAIAAYFVQVIERVGPAGAELWNVPKFIVSFGMILILLEDESLGAQGARDRERALNRQVERFAEITSQLLGAVDVPPFCEKIASVITEEGNFHRVVVLLADDTQHLHVAGYSGLPDEAITHVRNLVTGLTLESIAERCENGQQVGKNSYRIPSNALYSKPLLATTRVYAEHQQWRAGDEILVPLQSQRGLNVGCFLLDDPKDPDRLTPEELTKIELLAADLAVALDRTSMQRQIVQREKLVGIGQLVSGVAHELNNPLTAVLGYTELMSDYPLQPEVARDLGIVRREANRMKRIIENLLRFSRQSRTDTTVTDLPSVLQDVLSLREYDLNGRGIKLSTNLPEQLPLLSMDQSQLKIVLSNIVGNAIDAVLEAQPKHISIEVREAGDKVLIEITDSGPGFADLTRIFDPFFTTKSPGRGMGLGLSICYGIMRQHGGEIYASNAHPRGACITLELPAAPVGKLNSAAVLG